jgi:hypothetical protein
VLWLPYLFVIAFHNSMMTFLYITILYFKLCALLYMFSNYWCHFYIFYYNLHYFIKNGLSTHEAKTIISIQSNGQLLLILIGFKFMWHIYWMDQLVKCVTL